MKSDGPIILAVVLLAAGLTTIFSYGLGTAGFNAAYPISAANLNLSIVTTGPAALGGMALVVLGLLALAWALLCAVMGLFRNGDARLERLEQKRLEREEKLAQVNTARIQHEDELLRHEDRLRASFPRN